MQKGIAETNLWHIFIDKTDKNIIYKLTDIWLISLILYSHLKCVLLKWHRTHIADVWWHLRLLCFWICFDKGLDLSWLYWLINILHAKIFLRIRLFKVVFYCLLLWQVSPIGTKIVLTHSCIRTWWYNPRVMLRLVLLVVARTFYIIRRLYLRSFDYWFRGVRWWFS